MRYSLEADDENALRQKLVTCLQQEKECPESGNIPEVGMQGLDPNGPLAPIIERAIEYAEIPA